MIQSMTNIRRDNDVIECIDAVYIEIGSELSRPIEQDGVYYEKQTGQRRDPLYRYDL